MDEGRFLGLRRRFRPFLGMSALALVLLMSLAIGCGDDSTAKQLAEQEKLRQAQAEGARAERLRELEREVRQGNKSSGSTGGSTGGGGGSSPAPPSSGGPTSCGDGLTVGNGTTCEFARNIRQAYDDLGINGSAHLVVHSPVTGQDYEVFCTAGDNHKCTTPSGASAYFP